MSSLKIGHRILEYRKKNGLTIRDFAAQTNLSPSLLSQLERGIGNPSLSALKSIACVMGISLSTLFFEEIDTESLILRKSQRTQNYNPQKTHIVYNTLTPDPTKSNLELYLVILKPHSDSSEDFAHHTGEEIAMILEGQTEVTIEDDIITLYEGDTIRILPERKHKFSNKTNSEIQLLFARASLS